MSSSQLIEPVAVETTSALEIPTSTTSVVLIPILATITTSGVPIPILASSTTSVVLIPVLATSTTSVVPIPILESSSVFHPGIVTLSTITTEDANPTTLPSNPGVQVETTLQTATSLGSSAPLSTQSSTSLDSLTSLTTGAKAGIGVAAVIGAVLLMALGALISWAIRRQRRQKQKRNGIGISDALDEPPTSELPKLEHGPVEFPSAGIETQQLNGSGTDTHITRELDASGYSTNRRSRKELDGAHWRRELEGDTPNGTWTPTRS